MGNLVMWELKGWPRSPDPTEELLYLSNKEGDGGSDKISV